MSLADKRVLVTGGSGFIGSHLCRRLVDANAELYVMVKYNSVIDNVRLTGIWDRIKPFEADLRNLDSLRRLSDLKPHIIFHLAAYNHVGDSFTHVLEAMSTNSTGTANLMEAYSDYERFVYVSSSEVYGFQDNVPFREDLEPRPMSPYAVGKYSGELFAKMHRLSRGLPIVIVRPFNAFGPYQSPRAIIAETIIKCLLNQDIETTEGLQTREFNFVKNLVDGLFLASEHPDAIGQIVNLGCGDEMKIRDLVRKIHRLTASKSKLQIGALPTRPGEIMRMSADASKVKSLMGWEPKIDLDKGLTQTIEWYRDFLKEFGDSDSVLARLTPQ